MTERGASTSRAVWPKALIVKIAVALVLAGCSASAGSAPPAGPGAAGPPVVMPSGPAAKACLLTVDQVQTATGMQVREVLGGSGGQSWDYECVYANLSKADVAGLTIDQLNARHPVQLQILVACGADAGDGLSNLDPVSDSSVPGVTGNGSGLVAAPVAGGCWLGVYPGGAWDRTRVHSDALAVLALAAPAWQP